MSKIVFDIGGTNMRVARVQGDSLQNVLKIPTPKEAEDGVAALLHAMRQISDGEKVESVSGGMAGIISREGSVLVSPNLPGWNGCELGKRLRESVADRSTVRNDAEMAGLAEAVLGAGKDKSIVAYIGLGTGIGGCKVVDGRVDANTCGFEPGHHIVDISSGESFEDKVSGQALEKRYGKPAEELDRDTYNSLVGTLATGIYNIILLWSPEVVVLGGSLFIESSGFSVGKVREELDELPLIFPAMPEVRKSMLGDDAGLHGAILVMKGSHPSSVGRASHS